MELNNLWKDLIPEQDRINTIKLDLAEGKVPELPFFVIDEKMVKASLKKQLENIDGNRLQAAVISADYGNGKTNLLKYLQMFFKNNKNVCFLYTVADEEQSNIYLQLLELLQRRIMDKLIESIKKVQANNKEWIEFISSVADKYDDINEYTSRLLSATEDEELKNLIFLGTGRLYSKTSFKKNNITYFSNIYRRLILGYFLNILSFNKYFIIFAIDEIEKIYERSKVRLNKYLTTFREILDISSSIRGHFILSCITNSVNLGEINPPFNSRVNQFIYQLGLIKEKNDIEELITKLNILYQKHKTEAEVSRIAMRLMQERVQNNRLLLQKASEYLSIVNTPMTIQELLDNTDSDDLAKAFKKHKSDIKDLLKNKVSQVLFNTLEYYLISFNALNGNSKLDKRDFKMYYDSYDGIAVLFLFSNGDLKLLKDKIRKVTESFHPKEIVVYAPDVSDITMGRLADNNITTSSTVHLEYYNPSDLATLLDMYREDSKFQPAIAKLIHQFTNNIL
jgi:hypothetical protein